jgi:hypothetical protein
MPAPLPYMTKCSSAVVIWDQSPQQFDGLITTPPPTLDMLSLHVATWLVGQGPFLLFSFGNNLHSLFKYLRTNSLHSGNIYELFLYVFLALFC